MGYRWTRVAWAPVIAGLLASCAAGPSTRPALGVYDGAQPAAATTDAANAPPLESSTDDSLDWFDCGAQVRDSLTGEFPAATIPDAATSIQCSSITTNLDSPTIPDYGSVTIKLTKIGTGSIPIIVYNDVNGLPGGKYAATLAAKLDKSLLTKYSLIGVDRRGTGGSVPVHCAPKSARATLVNYDPTASNVDDFLAASRTIAQECQIDLAEQLAAVDSLHDAADLEEVRKALGVDHLAAIGHGEGSRVLSYYASKYAAHVGRFVFDGAVDPTPDALAQGHNNAAGAQAAFDQFSSWCTANKCGLGGNPQQYVLNLVKKLAADPNSRTVGGGAVLTALRLGLQDKGQWPALATALTQAAGGDTTALAGAVSPLIIGNRSSTPRLDPQIVTGCNDNPNRVPPQQISQAVQSWGAQYPVFGGYTAQQILLCTSWPINSAKAPAAPSSVPPIVVIGTDNDPITPGAGTKRFVQTLPTGVYVEWTGSGHGALGISSCATNIATTFLATATVPIADTTCPA